MLHWNPNLYPPSGWIYKDPSGTIHHASNALALVEKVSRYRNERGEKVETVWADIQEQLCKEFPSHCRKSGISVPGGHSEVRHRALSDLGRRASEWIRKIWVKANAGGLKYVDKAVSKERAAACEGCEFNRDFKLGCAACGDSTARIRQLLRAGRRIPKEAKLQGCELYGEDLGLAVLLDEPVDRKAGTPTICWRK